MSQHGSSLIALNRAKVVNAPNVHDCVLCGKSTSVVRPICPVCAKGLD